MINCRNIIFSETKSKSRIQKANRLLGEKIVKKIIGVALYWLGGNQEKIAEILEVPLESMRTAIRVFLRDGLSALEDRRCSESSFLPRPHQKPPVITLCRASKGDLEVKLGDMECMVLPCSNKLQSRTIVLSLLDSACINSKVAGEILGFSQVHSRNLAVKLREGDVTALLDMRQGQRGDYVFTPVVKSELILQCATNAMAGRPVTSPVLVKDLSERCKLDLSERSLRIHMEKLQLRDVAEKLPGLFKEIKKKC